MTQSTFELMASAAAKIEQDTRRETIDKIEEMLLSKVEAYEHLLMSEEAGRIYRGLFGEKFDKLHEKRQRLWNKQRTLLNVIEEINKLW